MLNYDDLWRPTVEHPYTNYSGVSWWSLFLKFPGWMVIELRYWIKIDYSINYTGSNCEKIKKEIIVAELNDTVSPNTDYQKSVFLFAIFLNTNTFGTRKLKLNSNKMKNIYFWGTMTSRTLVALYPETYPKLPSSQFFTKKIWRIRKTAWNNWWFNLDSPALMKPIFCWNQKLIRKTKVEVFPNMPSAKIKVMLLP